MNSPDFFIDIYGIKEVRGDVGEKMQTNELFVYTREQIPFQEKWLRPSRSTHFTMHLHLDEAIEITYNLINYTVQKNSLFIIHPGVVHVLKEVAQLPAISVGFTQEFFSLAMVHKKHPDALGFLSMHSNPLLPLTDIEAKTLHQLMLYFKNMANNNDHLFKEEIIYHGFNLVMLEVAAIAKKYRSNVEHSMTYKENILFSFLKQLSAYFKEERSVQFYADSLYMTPKHLTKTVKEITNKTSSEFIDEMVITEAKILLGDLSYSVAQVADHLHFSDQFFFSKYFKRGTGLSPKEYKNSL